MNPHDQNIYFGFMKQAHDGYWAFLNLPSNIIHSRQYIHTLFLLQGMFARFTGVPLVYIHLFSSYIFAVLFGFVIRSLCCRLHKDGLFTSLVLAVMLFGSGFGVFGKIYSSVFHHEITVKNMSAFPGDLWMPEMTVWNSICYTPLFIWSYLLIILIYGGIWLGELRKSFFPFLVAAVAVFLIALSHSYDLVPLGFLSLILLILFRIKKQKIWFKLPVFCGYCLYAVFFLGAMGYQYYVLKNNPGFSVWAAKNVNLSPDFTVILMGFGVISLGYLELILRFITWLRKYRQTNNTVLSSDIDIMNEASLSPSLSESNELDGEPSLMIRFMGFWLIVQTLMLYSPFPFARRFILAIFIPLVIFFIFFIKRILERKTRIAVTIATCLIIVSFFTPLYQLLANSVKVIKADSRFFYSRNQLAAYSSMNKGMDSSDVVFASFPESNRLLRFSPAAMIAGSTQQCSEEIQKDVRALFSAKNISLLPFLQKNRVSYIFLNKKNDKIFSEKYRIFLNTLSPVFENSNYIVYKLKK